MKYLFNNHSILNRALAFTFILGLLSYGYLITNGFYSHDGLTTIYVHEDDAWQISLGRYFQPVFRYLILGNVNSSWYTGILGLIFLGLSAYFICKLFRANSNLSIFYICSVITLNLSQVLLASTYLHFFSQFSFAQFLASVSAFLIFQKQKKFYILSSLLLGISLAVYQLFVSCFFVLFLLKLIQEMYDDWSGFKNNFISLIGRLIITSFASGFFYLSGLFLVLKFTGIGLSKSYNSLESAFTISGKNLSLIVDAYSGPISFFFRSTYYWPFYLSIFVFLLFVLFIVYVLRNYSFRQNLLAVCFVLFLPFLANLVVILTGGMSHDLMLIPTFYLLLIFIILSNKVEICVTNKLINNFNSLLSLVFVLFVFVFTLNSIKFSNILAEKKHLEAIQTFVKVVEVINRLATIPGYEPGITLVELVAPKYKIDNNSVFNKKNKWLGGYYPFAGQMSPSSITYTGTELRYFINYLNVDIKLKGITPIEFFSSKEIINKKGYLFKDGILYLKVD